MSHSVVSTGCRSFVVVMIFLVVVGREKMVMASCASFILFFARQFIYFEYCRLQYYSVIIIQYQITVIITDKISSTRFGGCDPTMQT